MLLLSLSVPRYTLTTFTEFLPNPTTRVPSGSTSKFKNKKFSNSNSFKFQKCKQLVQPFKIHNKCNPQRRQLVSRGQNLKMQGLATNSSLNLQRVKTLLALTLEGYNSKE